MEEYKLIGRARILADSLEGIVSLLRDEICRGELYEGSTFLELALDADDKTGDFLSWFNNTEPADRGRCQNRVNHEPRKELSETSS